VVKRCWVGFPPSSQPCHVWHNPQYAPVYFSALPSLLSYLVTSLFFTLPYVCVRTNYILLLPQPFSFLLYTTQSSVRTFHNTHELIRTTILIHIFPKSRYFSFLPLISQPPTFIYLVLLLASLVPQLTFLLSFYPPPLGSQTPWGRVGWKRAPRSMGCWLVGSYATVYNPRWTFDDSVWLAIEWSPVRCAGLEDMLMRYVYCVVTNEFEICQASFFFHYFYITWVSSRFWSLPSPSLGQLRSSPPYWVLSEPVIDILVLECGSCQPRFVRAWDRRWFMPLRWFQSIYSPGK